MNAYTWTIGASHTPAAFLATAGGALPFDVTDTVASLLFGLAFAPELARLLARMRARMDVSWEVAEAVETADDPHAAGALRSLAGAGPLAAMLLVGDAAAVGERCCRAEPSALPHRTARPRRLLARPRALLPERRPERGRGLRRRPRAVEQRALHRVGGDGPRRCRAQPGRRASRWAFGARLAARRSIDPARARRRRAHDSRRARVPCVGLLLRRSRPRLGSARRAHERQLVRRSGQPHGVCDLLAARGGALGAIQPRSAKRRAGSSASRTATAASASASTAPRATSTTRPRRCRRSRTPVPATRARSVPPRASWRAPRTSTAAIPSSQAANPTPSRPLGRCRA